MDFEKILNKKINVTSQDIQDNEKFITSSVEKGRFLVIGGAGTIGQAVVKEIFLRNPKALHVVDISENNMVELVRELRSSIGYIDGDFRTFAIDCGQVEFQRLVLNEGPYDYVFNLSALKHVRSEKDPYTLLRMIEVNIINTKKNIDLLLANGCKRYFCISTDKAANPVNLMGASKRIMEYFLSNYYDKISISSARFANVAFSDGSLLHGFNQRILKKQPLSAPSDVKRYFVSPKEAGEICILSGLLGDSNEIFFPKLDPDIHLQKFSDLAVRYLSSLGYKAHICETEAEARYLPDEKIKNGFWPCYFFDSSTTGEKPFEEFFTESESIDMDRFIGLGVIKSQRNISEQILKDFITEIEQIKASPVWNKKDVVAAFSKILGDFSHIETNEHLDNKM